MGDVCGEYGSALWIGGETLMPKIMRLKQWGEEGMPALGASQFLPVNASPDPVGGRGGQAFSLFVEGIDLEQTRGLNLGRLMQWAAQPQNRSLYIIDKQTINRRFAEIKRQIKEARKKEDKKKEKELIRSLDVRKAWSWADVMVWPVVPMAGNLVLVDEIVGKWARLIGMPKGIDLPIKNDGTIDVEKAIAKYPYWLHTVYCGSKGRGIVPYTKFGRFIMPFYSPAGRRSRGDWTEIWVKSIALKAI